MVASASTQSISPRLKRGRRRWPIPIRSLSFLRRGTASSSSSITSRRWHSVCNRSYRETQIGRMKPGDPVRVSIDTHPETPLCGYVESIASASGTEFAGLGPVLIGREARHAALEIARRERPLIEERRYGILKSNADWRCRRRRLENAREIAK